MTVRVVGIVRIKMPDGTEACVPAAKLRMKTPDIECDPMPDTAEYLALQRRIRELESEQVTT